MAYNITKTDGTNLVTVAEGTTDTSYSSLTLIGKNFAGYGEFINENFVHLLENFANSVQPPNPIRGQIWWNTSSNTMLVYDGTVWKPIKSSAVQSIPPAPASTQVGDMWWDTVNKQLKIWNGTAWTVIGPAYPDSYGVTGIIPESVTDTLSLPHIVLKIFVGGTLSAIWSKDTDFVITGHPGFTLIKPGLNLSSAVTGNTFAGTVMAPNGSVTSPSIGFANSTNTGFYLTTAGAIQVTTAGTHAATFTSSGNFVAVGEVVGFSDEKLKKNWESLPDDFIEKLAEVKSGTFERVDTKGGRQVGVSAQSLQTVLPEAVSESEDGTLGVAYGNAALAVCIELAKEVVSLRKRIEELEKK